MNNFKISKNNSITSSRCSLFLVAALLLSTYALAADPDCTDTSSPSSVTTLVTQT